MELRRKSRPMPVDQLAFDHNFYVPILKGKRGEFPALAAVKQKQMVRPLLEAVPDQPCDYIAGRIDRFERWNGRGLPAGRSGEPPALMLGEALKNLGLRGTRLKTGSSRNALPKAAAALRQH